MSLLKSLLGRKSERRAPALDLSGKLPSPDQPFFIVGDLHGCSDLMEQILEQIDHVIGAISLRDPQLVFVGDYIDRGPNSRGVLMRLQEMTAEFPDNVTCLLGNHEQMLLDFLDAPSARAARWLRNGGAKTCASYGQFVDEAGEFDANELAKNLRRAMGAETENWLRALPARRQSGNLTVVHAAADPARPLNDQSDRVLIWGHPEFMTRPRADQNWIAHGHTVVGRPVAQDSRVSVDTGAFETGVLSAAVILPTGEVDFLQARRD